MTIDPGGEKFKRNGDRFQICPLRQSTANYLKEIRKSGQRRLVCEKPWTFRKNQHDDAAALAEPIAAGLGIALHRVPELPAFAEALDELTATMMV
ncbi:MAG: hypothetical protein WCH07_07440 [Deltaproteobacteria bacterium]